PGPPQSSLFPYTTLFRSRNKNLRDFSLGGRSIPWWAVLASIVAAETSAATFLGTPAEGFKTRGYFYGQLVIGTILARVFIAFTLDRKSTRLNSSHVSISY